MIHDAHIDLLVRRALDDIMQKHSDSQILNAAEAWSKAITMQWYVGSYMCIALDRMHTFGPATKEENTISKSVIESFLHGRDSLHTHMVVNGCHSDHESRIKFYRRLIDLIRSKIR